MTTAELGFKIDSSQASAATRELDKLSASSAKAETAAQKLGLSFKTSGVQAADLLNNTNLSEKARARLAEQLQKQGVATNAVAVASDKLQKGQKAALDGVMSMAGGVKGLTEEHEKGDGAANRFVNTLTRRFVFGFIVSQLRQMVSSIADLNRELAKTGDVGNITGFGGQQIQGLQSAAARQGIGSAQFLDDILKFNQQIPLAKAGVGELGKMFRYYGVSVSDTTDAFFKLADLIKNAGNDTARMSLLETAGLPATRERLNFMKQGADAIKRQAEEAAKLTDQQLEQAKRIEEQWNSIGNSIERGLKRAIVNSISYLDDLERKLNSLFYSVNPSLRFNDAFDQMGGGGSPALRRGLEQRAAQLRGETGTRDKDAYATWKAKEQEFISTEQQKLGIYGQTTTAAEARYAVELQLRQLATNLITIDATRAETLKRLAEEQNLGITAIKQSANAYRVEAATVGMNVQQSAEYAAIQNAINAAKQRGETLKSEDIARIKEEARALGEAAKVADDMKFAYDTVKSSLSTFRSELQNGATVWEAFGKAAQNALNKIADKLADMALNNLWQAAFPTGGGGGFLQSIFSAIGGGGGASAGTIGGTGGGLGGFYANGGIRGPAGDIPLKTYASGGIADSPQMSVFGEGSMPEAYVPLPDGRRIPVNISAPKQQAWGNGGGTIEIAVTSRVDKDGNIKTYVERVSGAVAGQAVRLATPGIVQQSVGAVGAANKNSPGYIRNT